MEKVEFYVTPYSRQVWVFYYMAWQYQGQMRAIFCYINSNDHSISFWNSKKKIQHKRNWGLERKQSKCSRPHISTDQCPMGTTKASLEEVRGDAQAHYRWNTYAIRDRVQNAVWDMISGFLSIDSYVAIWKILIRHVYSHRPYLR